MTLPANFYSIRSASLPPSRTDPSCNLRPPSGWCSRPFHTTLQVPITIPQLSWIPLKPDHCLKSKAQNDGMGCELIVVATHVSIDIITLVVKVVTHTECVRAKDPVNSEHCKSID